MADQNGLGALLSRLRPALDISIQPAQTIPGSDDVLFVQTDAEFYFDAEIRGDAAYSGDLLFDVDDPIEVRTSATSENLEWNRNAQTLSFDEVTERVELKMRVWFPDRYRGDIETVLTLKPDDAVMPIARIPIKSDHPLRRTLSPDD